LQQPFPKPPAQSQEARFHRPVGQPGLSGQGFHRFLVQVFSFDQQSVLRFQFVQTLLEQRGQVIVRLGIQRDYRRRTRLGEPVQERAVPAALATAVARCVAGHHFQPVPQGFLGFEGPCVADDAKEGFLEGVPGLGFLPAGDDQQELIKEVEVTTVKVPERRLVTRRNAAHQVHDSGGSRPWDGIRRRRLASGEGHGQNAEVGGRHGDQRWGTGSAGVGEWPP